MLSGFYLQILQTVFSETVYNSQKARGLEVALDHLCIKKLKYFLLNSICLVPMSPNLLPIPFNFLSMLHLLSPSTPTSPHPELSVKGLALQHFPKGCVMLSRNCGFGPSPRSGVFRQWGQGWAKLPSGLYSLSTCSQSPGRKGGCLETPIQLGLQFPKHLSLWGSVGWDRLRKLGFGPLGNGLKILSHLFSQTALISEDC